MHHIWNTIRVPSRTLRNLSLPGIKPIMPRVGEQKLPFYPPPRLATLSTKLCSTRQLPGAIRERSESQCGSCTFCMPENPKNEDERYKEWGNCLNERTNKVASGNETMLILCTDLELIRGGWKGVVTKRYPGYVDELESMLNN